MSERNMMENHDEKMARLMKAVEWDCERGHAYLVECLDPPIDIAYNTKTGRRFLRISWRSIPAWFGDIGRMMVADFRKTRDWLRGVRNPHRNIF